MEDYINQFKLVAAIAPALAVMWYVDRLDAKRPEPRDLLRRVTIAGCLTVIPAIIIEYIAMNRMSASDPFNAALFIAALAGFTEELVKVAAFLIYPWRKPDFDERLDGIVYATRIGLGFAAVENVFYLFGAEGLKNFLFVAVVRALLAVPGHAIWAGTMGYFAARRRFDGRGPGIIGGYLIAALMHTLYDLPLFYVAFYTLIPGNKMSNGTLAMWIAIPILVIVLGGIWLRMAARRALAYDDAASARSERAALEAAMAQPAPPSMPPQKLNG